MGSHYRMDGTEGMILGETVAVQLLHQVTSTQGYHSGRSCVSLCRLRFTLLKDKDE